MLVIHNILGSYTIPYGSIRYSIYGQRVAVSRFFCEPPESEGKDTLLYSISSTTVVGWGLCGTFIYYFLNRYKTSFIEGGKLALVKEPFLCTLTANCRQVELLLSVSYDL